MEENESDQLPDLPIINLYDKPDEIAQTLVDFDSGKSIQEAVLVVSSYLVFFHEIKTNLKYLEAAGGIVSNHKHQVLVMYRLSTWDLPKGKIDAGESPEVAALREIKEECGISKTRITNELIPTFHTYRLKGKFVLKKTFWFDVLFEGNQKPVPQLEEDISEVKWIERNQFESILSNTYPSIKNVFLQFGWTE